VLIGNIVIIRSKADYEFYIKADKLALGKNYKIPRLIGDDVWIDSCIGLGRGKNDYSYHNQKNEHDIL
jgi:hypothetical protein